MQWCSVIIFSYVFFISKNNKGKRTASPGTPKRLEMRERRGEEREEERRGQKRRGEERRGDRQRQRAREEREKEKGVHERTCPGPTVDREMIAGVGEVGTG